MLNIKALSLGWLLTTPQQWVLLLSADLALSLSVAIGLEAPTLAQGAAGSPSPMGAPVVPQFSQPTVPQISPTINQPVFSTPNIPSPMTIPVLPTNMMGQQVWDTHQNNQFQPALAGIRTVKKGAWPNPDDFKGPVAGILIRAQSGSEYSAPDPHTLMLTSGTVLASVRHPSLATLVRTPVGDVCVSAGADVLVSFNNGVMRVRSLNGRDNAVKIGYGTFVAAGDINGDGNKARATLLLPYFEVDERVEGGEKGTASGPVGGPAGFKIGETESPLPQDKAGIIDGDHIGVGGKAGRSRMSANEASASGALKTIPAAQTDYNQNPGNGHMVDPKSLSRKGEAVNNAHHAFLELLDKARTQTNAVRLPAEHVYENIVQLAPGFEFVVGAGLLGQSDIRPSDGTTRANSQSLDKGQVAVTMISVQSVLNTNDLLREMALNPAGLREKQMVQNISKRAAVLDYVRSRY